ncbi:TylF/MycF family methyltransferase [bacterium]|nr:TylF/MycF family methyltransferase [bacterium]
MLKKILSKLDNRLSRKPNYSPFLNLKSDHPFFSIYEKAVILSDTPTSPGSRRSERFFNLISFLDDTLKHIDGNVIEFGCWKGLSSYLISSTISNSKSDRLITFEIVDSFEGLSSPTADDSLTKKTVDTLIKHHGSVQGALSSSESHLFELLSGYQFVNIHKGWIPDVLSTLHTQSYCFAHIDVDLYQPTLSSIEYIYPLLTPGGVIICDDYNLMSWPGASKAVDELQQRFGFSLITLSTGQGLIRKPLH